MKHSELLELVASKARPQCWDVTVPIDQISDTSVAAMIHRATSGQPVLGNPDQVYDGQNRDAAKNPLNSFGLDLDDVIEITKANNQEISDLKDKYDKIQKEKIDTGSKEVSVEETVQ